MFIILKEPKILNKSFHSSREALEAAEQLGFNLNQYNIIFFGLRVSIEYPFIEGIFIGLSCGKPYRWKLLKGWDLNEF